VFHRESFSNISEENSYCTFFFVFIYKKGELSSGSAELTRSQDISLGMLYEQATGNYFLKGKRQDLTPHSGKCLFQMAKPDPQLKSGKFKKYVIYI